MFAVTLAVKKRLSSAWGASGSGACCAVGNSRNGPWPSQLLCSATNRPGTRPWIRGPRTRVPAK
eukprot:10257150-Lingulodinium_polyedra.AAC.1